MNVKISNNVSHVELPLELHISFNKVLAWFEKYSHEEIFEYL